MRPHRDRDAWVNQLLMAPTKVWLCLLRIKNHHCHHHMKSSTAPPTMTLPLYPSKIVPYFRPNHCTPLRYRPLLRSQRPRGAGGMYRERIRSNPNWHGYPRRDTVLVNVGGPVMRGLVIGRVQSRTAKRND
ncbi:hypothetical protein C8F04DRAFT_1134281 [Mycena alexandri]|uniref:Uncharacterized protein n=1 Tax=Mycena alexandri TaxID=1745969 RepID=A0AAD6SDF5_9AGAR|nr:hypothetical protein C8F04DRAFT_1134281 [Mycena alexandri]